MLTQWSVFSLARVRAHVAAETDISIAPTGKTLPPSEAYLRRNPDYLRSGDGGVDGTDCRACLLSLSNRDASTAWCAA